MEPNVLVAKVLAWATYSTLATIVAAVAEAPVIIMAVGSVLGFAGLLVRQILVSQKSLLKIIEQKDSDNLDLRIKLDVVEWERERARWRSGEREDPGPYVMRSDLAQAQAQRSGRIARGEPQTALDSPETP